MRVFQVDLNRSTSCTKKVSVNERYQDALIFLMVANCPQSCHMKSSDK